MLLLLAPTITLTVASEFIVVGLLPRIATELNLSLAMAGQLTAVFAMAAALAGPVVTLAAGRLPPRAFLIIVTAVFAVGNGLTAFTDNFTLMLAARALQGALLPAVVSVGAAQVARLAPTHARGRALAHANFGFVLGVLLALPAGVLLAQWGTWRLPFQILAVAALPTIVCIAALFPRNSGIQTPVRAQLDLLRRARFLGHLMLTVVLFAAMFSAYTYLGAWLHDAMGLDLIHVAILLLGFGAVGLLANSLAARVADSAPMIAAAVAIVSMAVAVNVTTLSAGSVLVSVVPLIIWAASHFAGVTLSQVRVTMAGGEAPAFAMTMNISAANLGIALGAVGGGWSVSHWGLAGIGIVAAALTPVAVALTCGGFVRTRLSRRRRRQYGMN